MMLLTAVMKAIGNVWFFVALLAAVYVLACVLLRKYFAEE